MTGTKKLQLDSNSLTPGTLIAAASNPVKISLCQTGRQRMIKARQILDQAVAEHIPIYGVTTGLGAKVNETLSAEQLAEFSYKTIRGRAHAVGKPVEKEIVRAAMIVRLNTLLNGAAAVSPEVAEHILNCLNANLTPAVGRYASIGAGDLVWNASMVLSLIGEGPMYDAAGNLDSGANIMRSANITVPALGPKDGLALCNNSSFSSAMAAQAFTAIFTVFKAAQTAAALSMEGFRANLSPLNAAVLALRPQPGQQQAADELLQLLQGSSLFKPGMARRLQDPLSIRNLAQIHGAVYAALEFAGQALKVEINGASDNPVALIDSDEMVSAGSYHTPHLSNAIEAVSRSTVHLAMAQLARISKMLSDRFSGLPLFLAEPGSDSNGFAPLMKTAESLVCELAHQSQPVQLWPSVNADGVEDSLTATPTAARALLNIAQQLSYLCAIELMIAVRAIELADADGQLGYNMKKIYQNINQTLVAYNQDRPLTTEIETLAKAIAKGDYSRTWSDK